MRRFLYSLVAASCLFLLVGAALAVPGLEGGATRAAADPGMPRQCRTGKTSTETIGWRWRPNARVKVYYVKGDFSAAETAALSRAVAGWNRALAETESGIVFTVGGERDEVAEGDSTVTVLRGEPKGKDRLGQIKFYTMSNGVRRATIIMSPTVTGLDALTSLLTHEIGHSVGLADCYDCKRGTTAMSAFKDLTRGNEVYEPSECDRYVVASGYTNGVGEQARLAAAGR